MPGSFVTSLFDTIGTPAAMGVGAGGGFFMVKWAMEWVAGRLDRREARIDGGTDKLIASLERRVEALTNRLDEVEKALRECQAKHSASEAEVMKLKAIIDSRGEVRARAAQVVAADRLNLVAREQEQAAEAQGQKQ